MSWLFPAELYLDKIKSNIDWGNVCQHNKPFSACINLPIHIRNTLPAFLKRLCKYPTPPSYPSCISFFVNHFFFFTFLKTSWTFYQKINLKPHLSSRTPLPRIFNQCILLIKHWKKLLLNFCQPAHGGQHCIGHSLDRPRACATNPCPIGK